MTVLYRLAGLSLREDEELQHVGGAQSRAAAPHWEEPVEVVQTSGQDRGDLRHNGKVVSQLAKEHLGIPPADLVQVAGDWVFGPQWWGC